MDPTSEAPSEPETLTSTSSSRSAPGEIQARWVVAERDFEAEAALRRELGIPSVVAAILARRGYVRPEDAERFLNPELSDLHPPRLLPDFDEAVALILGARERRERVYVHGDYDVDGVTSAALFSRFLSKIGCDVITHVPHRERDGYGLHVEAVEDAVQRGAKLLVTCDCGISAVREVEAARAVGMKVLVTDHHTVGSELPRAEAVVNPHRSDSVYPFEELSGVGVAFKLCAGVAEELGLNLSSYHKAYLDLAALGTIADLMPLIDENRVFAAHGLEQMRASKKPGIQALLRTSKVVDKAGDRLLARHVSFGLGPRLNAAGRIDDAALALRLLMTADADEADRLAGEIEGLNERRKQEQESIVEEAIESVLRQGLQERPVIVVSGEGWHGGVIGIVAGKLVERFGRPAFVVTIDPETGAVKGSARSIPAFNVADAVRAHPGLLSGGGHAMAAGFSSRAEKIDDVKDALLAFGEAALKPEDLVPVVQVDLEADPGELDLDAAEQIGRLEPYGIGNPEPLFLVRDLLLADVVETRNPSHPQALLAAEGKALVRAPAFNLGGRGLQAYVGDKLDVLIRFGVDEYQGRRRVRWVLRDFRRASS